MRKIKYILISLGSTSLKASADVRLQRLDNTSMLNLKVKCQQTSVAESEGRYLFHPLPKILNYFLCTSGQVRLCYPWLVVAQAIPLCFPVHVHDFYDCFYRAGELR